MKKSLLVISIVLALAIAIGGCATKGDLEEVQTREKAIGARADQAAQDAEAAKASADEAVAEERERIAAEKERIAEEKAKQAEAAFQKSMKK
jgi:murein lipoprotein